jgi:hypothetical protein
MHQLDGLHVPLFLVPVEDEQEVRQLGFGATYEIQEAGGLSLTLEYRGVELDRLPTILSTGIDVEPSDAVLYVSTLEKALEYGGLPKAVIVLDPDHLERTWRTLPADSAAEEVERIQQTYPTKLTSTDGTKLWCSRLSEDDPRITTDYETAYARWIPGDPLEALQAVFVLGTPAFVEDFLAASNSHPDWRPSADQSVVRGSSGPAAPVPRVDRRLGR